MKKSMFLLALCVLTMVTYSQWYVSPSYSVYNGTGNFAQKSMVAVEVGKSVDVLNLGVNIGVTDMDSYNAYVEFRPSVMVFSHDKTSVCLTLGVGHIFDSQENFLTEYCATLCQSIGKRTSVCLFGGRYNFDGKGTSSKWTFVGTRFTYSFNKRE